MNRSAREIQDWLVARIATLTGIVPEEIDADDAVRRYGLDSVAVVTMIADLESWLGIRFRENPLDEHPTIALLAAYLAKTQAKADGQ